MTALSKILDLLTPRERKHAGLLIGMILVMALLDLLGVASILPFIALLSNPQLVETNSILNGAYTVFNFTDPQDFLFAFGLLVFLLLGSSLAFKALTTYAQLRFVLMREYSIARRLVEGYLRQPYSWFLNRHSADLGKTILSEVSVVVSNSLMPTMQLIAHSSVALALLTLLIIIDPLLALVVGLTLIAAYGLVFKFFSGLLSRVGKERLETNQKLFTAVSEVFGAVKEVKVGGLEQTYIQRFDTPARTNARHHAKAQLITQLPRFALELIVFGGMLLLVLHFVAQRGSFTSALPVIALYAFAGYRLMPSLQQIYGALSQLRFSGPALDALHKDLMGLQPASSPNSQEPAIVLNKVITLNNVVYRYPNATTPALRGISLTIPAKTTVGLVGATGSGKTTTVDLILGLLEAQEGTLAIDNRLVTEHNKRAWQRTIGYVPQQIYLADASIAANIAFGIDPKDISQEAVERAARLANLHDFVSNELPNRYETTVGERGVRLSGGQRQRIGIARALYHYPQVLVFDEATSALDNLTERAVIESLRNLGHEVTIILIAHRLSTVRECDQIFLLEKGEVKGQGRFEELARANKTFRLMAANS
jgi:ATP-binding cassette, subfamily B, bacterial PglK